MAPRFIDPFKVECPGCGGESLHSVASLKALEAQCPLCHRSLRETGEWMNAFLREAENDIVAMLIMWGIEDLDERVKFDSQDDPPHFTWLNDVIAATDKALAQLPPSPEAKTGEELVRAVVKAMLPAIDCPQLDLPLVDAFDRHQTHMMEDWHSRGRKHRLASLGRQV
jgi:hypothetical protein